MPSPYSDVEGRAFVERQLSRVTTGEGIAQVIAEAGSDRAVGQIVILFRHPPAASNVAGLGYWIIDSARRRGFATRAVRLIVPWALAAGIGRLEALVEPTNHASCRVLDATGFHREGLLRSYLGASGDAVMYSVTTEDLGGEGTG